MVLRGHRRAPRPRSVARVGTVQPDRGVLPCSNAHVFGDDERAVPAARLALRGGALGRRRLQRAGFRARKGKPRGGPRRTAPSPRPTFSERGRPGCRPDGIGGPGPAAVRRVGCQADAGALGPAGESRGACRGGPLEPPPPRQAAAGDAVAHGRRHDPELRGRRRGGVAGRLPRRRRPRLQRPRRPRPRGGRPQCRRSGRVPGRAPGHAGGAGLEGPAAGPVRRG